MEVFKTVLILVFIIVSYKFYTKFSKHEYDDLISVLAKFESTECPFGIYLYRLKTPNWAYQIQIQARLPHKLTEKANIFRRCEKESIRSNASYSDERKRVDKELKEYETIDVSTSFEFDAICDTAEYGNGQQTKHSNHENSNPLLDYLLEVVRWPDSPVTSEKTTASEAWSINTLSRGIFPGTLWCGFGNVADDMYSQLGEHSETDGCCRSHDLCKPLIRAFETRYHFSNPGMVPISHCACDRQFYDCLMEVNSPTSKMIGKIFFNLVKMKCFDFDVREVCTSTLLGLCRLTEKKCVAVLKNNKPFPT